MCKLEILHWKFRFIMYTTVFEVIILFCFIAHTQDKMRALNVFSISLVVGPTRCLLISYVIMSLPT